MAGDITFGIRLTADSSGYTGTVRLAAQQTKELADAARDAGKGVEGMGGSMTGAVAAGTVLGRIAGDVASSFVKWAAATVGQAAALKDWSDATGSSVESLSRLNSVARISGVSQLQLSVFTQRLAVDLAGVDDQSKQASRALEALGITAKDPAEAMEQLAKKLAQYADGANKAALVQEILGRGAQVLLPYLKDLAEQQDIGATTTRDQAEAAEHMEKSWRALGITLDDMRNRAVGPLIEDLNTLLDTAKKFGTLGSIFGFLSTDAGDKEDPGSAAAAVRTQISSIKEQIGELQAFAKTHPLTSAINDLFGHITGGTDLNTLNAQLTVLQAKLTGLEKLAKEGPDVFDLMGKPQAPAVLKAQTQGVDEFAKAWTNAQKELSHANEALNDIGKTEAEKTMPAMRTLVDLMNSPAWDKFTGAQKDAIVEELAQAETLEREAAAHRDAVKAIQEHAQAANALNKIFEKLDADTMPDFAKQLAEVDKPIESIRDSLTSQNTQLLLQVETFGLSEEAAIRFVAAQHRIAVETSSASATIKQEALDAIDLNEKLQLSALGQRQYEKLFGDIRDGLSDAVIDGINNGGKSALDDLKRMFDQLVLRPIIQAALSPISGSITQLLTGGAPSANALAGASNNPILNLFTGGKGIGNVGSDLLSSFLTSGAGQALGLSSAVGGTAGIAADAVGLIPGGAAADIALTGAGAALSAAASFIPYVGAALAAASALGLFDKKPSPAKGQFEISPGTTGFEDNAFVSSRFGNLGFNDANTQQFSGDAAKAFDQLVGGAIDAFASRFSKEQSDHFAEVLKTMTFDTFEGTFTTEDFLQKYGGQVLQQVVTAAFEVLNPALASVIANFKGTADEVAKFANSLLAINDATSKIGNDTFTANVDAALQGADQATADKVLAFVTITQEFGNSIADLAPKLEALDPDSITKFIDALGGAQQAITEMTFVHDNFTTSAQRASQTEAQLTSDFAALGLTVPKDHAAFLALLDSIDLTTDAGRTLYAAIAALAPEFVAVAGTADQVAQALAAAAQKGQDYYNQHFLSPQQQTDQRIGVDETALYNATKSGTLLNNVLTTLGLSVIPSTVQGVQDLVAATLAKYGADSDEYKTLLAIIPVIGDLIDATGGFGDAATAAADAAVQAASDIQRAFTQIDDQLGRFTTNLGNLGELAGQAKDFGTQLSDAVLLYGDQVTKLQAKIAAALANPTAFNVSQVQYVYQPELAAAEKALAGAQSQLAEFQDLNAQYGADKAAQLVQLEDQYAQEQKLYAGNDAALAILRDNFNASWNDIVNGVATGVNSTLDNLQRLKDGIAHYLQGLFVGNLSPLSPQEQLDAAQARYQQDLAASQASNPNEAAREAALQDITQAADSYIKLFEDANSVASQASRDLFSTITHELGDLAGTLPNGLPLSSATPQLGEPINHPVDGSGAPTDALNAALPANGTKLVSNADLAAQVDRLAKLQAAAAAQASGDAATLIRTMQALAAAQTRPTNARLLAAM
jgi:hypothetical protein